jgi:(1->4)-alpha-D-glucan 1-alpha-D-glucosylmutase
MPGSAVPHRPAPGRPIPTATYRLQIQPAFTFADAAAQADYLAALGVSHAYLSPVLQPAEGSVHGYDVIDHDRLNDEAGGRSAFDALVQRLHTSGVRAIADVVPNHMTTPTPAWLNRQWWSLLRDGEESEFVHWFDVDWAAEDGRVLLPVLGAPLGEVLDAGELAVAQDGGSRGDETVLRYYDHVFPVRPGTEALDLPDLLAAQCYRLCHWREGSTRLNYRRFFDVTTLAAVRVEDPAVFDATHELLLELFSAGLLDGFRIDHPDGLADPRGYLARLADVTGDAWVVAEKILEGDERLPGDWRCAGTTGYDALLRIGGVFVDPDGEEPLTDVLTGLVGERQELESMVPAAKRQVLLETQVAELGRLMRLGAAVLPDRDEAGLRRALEALLVAMDRYRAYVVPGEEPPAESVDVLDEACARARPTLDDTDHDSLSALRAVALGRDQGANHRAAAEFVVRFQQTCGPVMAKAIEDTAFYRYTRLTGLNEVGGSPDRVGIDPAELHAFGRRQLATWPTAMTTLSTHDTKRSEDVRARLAVLSELPLEWGEWLEGARTLAAAHREDALDAQTEYLLWQTAVGAWPISTDRLQAYANKAVREAKLHTTWTEQNRAYETAVARLVDGLTTDPAIGKHITSWVEHTGAASRAVILGQKLLQLMMPGVPDVYQGTEVVDLSLVDPDNRRLVDYASRRQRLDALDAGQPPRDLDDEKILVTSRALRLRRDHPEWFVGEQAVYEPVETSSAHALAVGRGDASGVQSIALVTRLAARLERSGGWGEATLRVPTGRWVDVLTGRPAPTAPAGEVPLRELLDQLPVALLVRDDTR